MARSKSTIVTFKADESLLASLGGVPNRSEFIRNAVLSALEYMCPLCRGAGILTPEQRKHWASFSSNHDVKECDDCHEWYLVCNHDESLRAQGKRKK